ncbi:MAG: tetratricopeptide repeat protein [Myxococcales bacterium]
MRLAIRGGVLLLAIVVLGCAGEKLPIASRPPLQSDVDLCALRAVDLGDRAPMGRIRLHLLVRTDGSVYAAYVHNAGGIDNRGLQRCLADRATTWVLAPAAVEYERAFELSFVPGGSELGNGIDYWTGQGGTGEGRTSVMLPDMTRSLPPLPIEQPLARDTLIIADFATPAEQGTALVAVGRAAEAVEFLRVGIAQQPGDSVALLGLTRALTATGGDLDEARATARHLLEIAPESVLGHEAMLRVCLAARDSECSLREWSAAVHAADAGARSRILFELQAPTQRAALRLQARRADPSAR